MRILVITILCIVSNVSYCKSGDTLRFTRADSVRGSIFPERAWWNVLRYDVSVKPDYDTKSISGRNDIKYKVVSGEHPLIMQIDLQKPMIIDSMILNSSINLDFKNEGNAWFASVPQQDNGSENSLLVYFHGEPIEAKQPPWDGGWVWSKDSLGNPWTSAACQGLGASVWYPCKDHQSDEPDNGASLEMIVPSDLVGVSNGRLISKTDNEDGTTSYKWEVTNPINNYNLIPNIGKYSHIEDTYAGENGTLDIDIWALDYNLDKVKSHVLPEVKRMLEAFEHWMGPYPFYEDSYKIIETPYAGMEHQSGIAYGNKYLNGFWGMDLSGSGWGRKFDYIIVHESGHEWFGNNITTNDIADLWVHEGFTCYTETLFIEYWFGKKAADEYVYAQRKAIQNKKPVIGAYNVNNDNYGGDMYNKGANMINSIRNSIGNDIKFREILRGMQKTFYHQTVDGATVESYINENSGFDFSKVFDQYLRNTNIPNFEYYFSKDKQTLNYRYTNCIKGFNLPLTLQNGNDKLKLFPTKEWQKIRLSKSQAKLIDPVMINKHYYVNVLNSKKLRTTG